ncbi:hypothetical protein V8E51_013651 [Hyaloscypha variabilis]
MKYILPLALAVTGFAAPLASPVIAREKLSRYTPVPPGEEGEAEEKSLFRYTPVPPSEEGEAQELKEK